ncbi:MAG TPA: alpha-ketoglutarate-dependent dioxygenase AlkB [Vitreimonas sp.]|uniref:alpha-ketoglutarate-dependent dioxygenase AlkB n=1 Tax=Vitreimonas sp. TaxID=3069702 RepID=UPI002D60CFD7|nr:alpha-ketoglutarate-dependent dioxygenase AlkB [Vitreimonas sp.]HYD89602.1 alpha-ketoglutarate-dependent dioxygenase AlkB [Vitreimonas sp.]
MTRSGTDLDGFRLWPGLLDRAAQEALRDEVFARMRAGPLYIPRMPKSGQPMRVRMTNFGPLGWVTDKEQGYRYQDFHPETGMPWPAMPPLVLDLWRELSGYGADPEACLVNLYEGDARMGLHVDSDEAAWDAPVLSISLGDTAIFRIGGALRSDPTRSVRLASGDVCLLAGAARRAYHGVDRILPGTSRLLPKGGRLNLTLRRVTVPS